MTGVADACEALAWRFTLGIQRELPGNFLVELTYLGQRGQNFPYDSNLNFVPEFREGVRQRPVPKAGIAPTMGGVPGFVSVGLTGRF